MPQDRPEYKKKKAFFDQMLTIFGRKPVLEALQDSSLPIYKLHLADSNKRAGIIDEMVALAEKRGITIEYHSKQALSRISRNAKQDQGVAADIQLSNYQSIDNFLAQRDANKPFSLIAVDRVTNPQNLGMIIRSVCAGYVDGLLIPKQGCAALSPLVIKASAGTLFKAQISYCNTLLEGLREAKQQGAKICTLSSHASTSLFEQENIGSVIYVLGNETDGVSREISALSDMQLSIPMNNQVESLNVAVTAALIAFNHSA